MKKTKYAFINIVKYTNMCKMKLWYFDYISSYHEMHFYIKIQTIGQPK